jgi:membrane-bound serine protease (ClpP class)
VVGGPLVWLFLMAMTQLVGVACMLGRVQKTGNDAMPGKTGTVVRSLVPRGTVFVEGEYWTAVSDSPVDRGKDVRVLAVEGMQLRVEPVDADTAQRD